MESVLHNAKNWDDVIQNFDQKFEIAPNQGQVSEQAYVINLIHELFITVDEKEIRRVFLLSFIFFFFEIFHFFVHYHSIFIYYI